LSNISFLCLNENIIESLEGIENFINLKELQINFNMITKIQNTQNLDKLEKFWICENQIKNIENLPMNLTNFWIAFNLIEKLEMSSFKNYNTITEINLAGNFLCSFNDLHILSKFENLKILNLADPNFGENPICLINNYRIFVFHKIPNLYILDEIIVTKEEINENKIIINKKNTFYKNKIKQMNRVSKSCLNMLKNFNFFYKTLKLYQIEFFRSRLKMLEFLKFERKIVREISNQNKFETGVCEEKEISSSIINNINSINNLTQSKEYEETHNKINKSIKEFTRDNLLEIKNEETNNNNQDLENDFTSNKNSNNEMKKSKIINSNMITRESNAINTEEFTNTKKMESKENTNISISENFEENPSDEQFFDEVNSEIDLLNSKINKAIENIKTCDNNYRTIKNFISEINDFSIIR